MRSHYLIHCILSGKGVYRTSARDRSASYQLHQGQAFLIEPNCIVHYSADGDDPWEYIWIEFDGLKAREFIHQAGLSQECPIFHAASPADEDIFAPLLYMLERPDLLPAQTMGYAYLFFGALMQHSATARPMPANDIDRKSVV